MLIKSLISTRTALCTVALIALAGCFPSDINGRKPDGNNLKLTFYPGGNTIDDLVIYEGNNYFGKAQYQIDDPMGDIGFRLNSGERVQAECVLVGKDIIGNEECKRYEVYRSSWDVVPEGTIFDRPQLF